MACVSDHADIKLLKVLVVSFMAFFVLSFFPLDVLDGIWDLIESVSEGFLTYSIKLLKDLFCVHCSSIGQLVMKEDTDVSGGKLRCRDSALR